MCESGVGSAAKSRSMHEEFLRKKFLRGKQTWELARVVGGGAEEDMTTDQRYLEAEAEPKVSTSRIYLSSTS